MVQNCGYGQDGEEPVRAATTYKIASIGNQNLSRIDEEVRSQKLIDVQGRASTCKKEILILTQLRIKCGWFIFHGLRPAVELTTERRFQIFVSLQVVISTANRSLSVWASEIRLSAAWSHPRCPSIPRGPPGHASRAGPLRPAAQLAAPLRCRCASDRRSVVEDFASTSLMLPRFP